MSELRKFKNEELIQNFKKLVANERRLTAEIIDYIKEIDCRKLYLGLGHSNMFTYLTREMGYTPASAQRRIDSARLLRDLPEIKDDISSGALNLSQLSVVAQSVRAKERETTVKVTGEERREIIQQIQSQDLSKTQQTVAKFFEIEPVVTQKIRHQSDRSARIEITLNEKQLELVNRVKELLSSHYEVSQLNDVLEYLCADFLKRKDPIEVENRIQKKKSGSIVTGLAGPVRGVTENPKIIAARAVTSDSEVPPSQTPKSLISRRAISSAVRRAVLARDRCCQWEDRVTRRRCGSRMNLEVDHIRPVWAGGDNSPQNLQVLCAAHNRAKYRTEANTRFVSTANP